MAKEIKKNEFRKNNSKEGQGHPAHIYAQKGKKFIYIGKIGRASCRERV